MDKKLLLIVGICLICGVLFSYFFIFSNSKNNEKNGFLKPKKIIVQKNSQKIEDKNIKKIGEAKNLMNIIDQVLKNRKNISEYEINVNKGEYLNSSKLSNLHVLVIFLDNSTNYDIYSNIIFKRPINGKYFVGYYYEKDDNVKHIVFSKNKEDVEKYLKEVEQEEENEKYRTTCPACNVI